MKKLILPIAVCCLLSTWTHAQKSPTPAQRQSIEAMINAYNEQDFGGMKKPWGLLGKVLVTKKKLRKEFAPFHQRYGRASIDTIRCSSIYTCTAILSLENNRYKRSYLRFIFNDKAKLQGFGFGYPVLIYPRLQTSEPSNFPHSQKTRLIDSIIDYGHQREYPHDLSGCIMALDGNEVVYKHCFGYADVNQETPLNDSTRFLLASCSKQFTAMGIMLLEEHGKLNYQDDVRKYIPELPYEGISIENLLTHTSGLPDYMPLLKKHWNKNLFATNEDVIALLVSEEPALLFAPNQDFKYSNTGYVLLSSIIQQVSGQSFGDFIAQHIFEPLGMDQSLVYARRAEDTVVENYAYGSVYERTLEKHLLPDSLESYDYVVYQDAITGDDGVSSSIHDLAIWHRALQEGLLVDSSTMARAHTRHKLSNGETVNYGYGVFLEGGKTAEPLVYHTGGWPGYTTVLMRFPERDQGVIILSNNSYDRFLHLADEIASILIVE